LARGLVNRRATGARVFKGADGGVKKFSRTVQRKRLA
jgi:hypothetical protein